MSAFEGRRRALEAGYSLPDNGLERLVIPGQDPSRNPADLPLPASGLPSRIAGRVALLRFVTPRGVAALTQAEVLLAGATVRWMVTAPDLGTVQALDGALQQDELDWFGALAAAIDAQPGLPGRWLIVHTEAALPATVSVDLRASPGSTTPPSGFEARLASLHVAQDPPFSAAARAAWLNAIHHVLVADQRPLVSERLRQRVVFVRFASAFGVTDLRASNLSITGGVRQPEVHVRWAWPLADIAAVVDPELTAAERAQLGAFAAERAARGDAEVWLAVCTEERGDFSLYTLRVSGDPLFDVLLSAATVNFKVDCPSPLDCRTDTSCSAELPAPPVLDYLTRDFNGFRRLLLDRLAVLGAADAEQSPAGMWSVLVDLIAARADQLAYAQDAVATEAYLHTARLRPSVRRHARLLDYRMHEGVNARAFVHLVASAGVDRADVVAAGDLFLTRLLGASALLPPDTLETTTLPPESQVFRALLPLGRLLEAHNEIAIYAWGEGDLCLPRGTTRCTLLDTGRALKLKKGDLLLLEATASAATRAAEDADPALRHVVRLSKEPKQTTDPLLAKDVLDVEWLAEDALPFDLPVLQDGRPLAVARGNLTLVDHGRPFTEDLAVTPWGGRGRLGASLGRTGLTFATAPPIWDDTTAPAWQTTTWSASQVVRQAPQQALPAATLLGDDSVTWTPQRDLLASDRSAAEFWVEMESSGRAWIRFGDDTTGRRPGADAAFKAQYRTGNGVLGNVGAGAIAHLLSTKLPASELVAVRNPLPAVGGVDPEPLDVVRKSAPYAFRTQERAVTLADWAEVASRHREVQRAVARIVWTGSWHTVRVHIDRVEGRPVNAEFVAEITAFLERYRMAGYALEVRGPEYVPLDIVLAICVERDAWPEAVASALQRAFGTGLLPDGTRAFFHPDNFTFGQSVYLSQIVATAMAVPGVRWVDARPENPANHFRRWSTAGHDELASGVLRVGALEIIQCESNPSAPERGRIHFNVEGGA
ncbi:putative baseplate assembly protein [Sorangium sp. So ce281]|uniref:putative baseplate assembly protein n=1 Tax=unclassified Sorangium TaxID=2621164 RepID=UPI003F6379AE